jgi:hypothetical protein
MAHDYEQSIYGALIINTQASGGQPPSALAGASDGGDGSDGGGGGDGGGDGGGFGGNVTSSSSSSSPFSSSAVPPIVAPWSYYILHNTTAFHAAPIYTNLVRTQHHCVPRHVRTCACVRAWGRGGA